MQTTLLGLAIALILALIAALVGPFFIDWSQFRPQFEAEATRVVGMPVRVAGALDARLLPAPSLQLHGITVGGANDLGRLRAEKLNVEFSLGSLLRGEWRATELTVNGAMADLGLDARGRLDLPASTGPFNLGALSIDRLNLTGRAILHDAASRTDLDLNDIAFSGDVRSLAAGAMRGDGNFTWAGSRYPFRISSGQTNDGRGTRLRFAVDAGEASPGVDIDGVVTFEDRAPSFDGAIVVASVAAVKGQGDASRLPWRVTGKVKADAAQAQFDGVDASYGFDDAALKLTGVANVRFGASPLLHAVLSAKQLDIDRLLAKQDDSAANTPIAALRKLAARAPQLPLPTQIEMSAEQISLGGRPVQDVGVDLHGDKQSWAIERLEFRAPGATRVLASGAAQASGDGFAGAVSLDSAEPVMLAAWLNGRNDARPRAQKPLRIRGNFVSRADRLAIEGLKAEIDGGTVQGRVALTTATGKAQGSRIDADLRADRLDLDATTALLRSLSGPQAEWPDAGQLSLDIGQAISAGQQMQPFAAQIAYDPKTVTLTRFKVGEAGGLTLDGSGAFDRMEATGRLALNATAPSLAQIGKVIAPLAPQAANRLGALPTANGAARLGIAFDLTRPQAKSDRANARLVFDVDAPQLKGTTTITATPAVAALRAIDAEVLKRSALALETHISGQGSALLTLLGLNTVFAADNAPLNFDASASGTWGAPLQLKAKLLGGTLDAEMQGSGEPWAAAPKASLSLAVRNANIAPLLDLNVTDAFAQKASLSSRLSLAGDSLILDDIDGTLAGSRMRGHLALTLRAPRTFDGQLGTDDLDLAPAFAFVIGARGHEPGDPLSAAPLQGWRGKLAFQTLRAKLPGGSELQPLSATVASDGQALTIDAIKGKLGGGDLSGDMDLKPSAAAGYALSTRIELSGVDGSSLRYRGLAMPGGKTSLKMSMASQGRSASALAGGLAGTGVASIDGLRIAGLDPHVFDAAIGASDAGQVGDDGKLKQLIEAALLRGEFGASSVQVPFSIKDSRLRVGATTLEADGARAVVSGGYDIVADQADIRASLSGSASGNAKARPEIELFWAGPPDRLERIVDVASLSSWLAVRAIDRETRRLDLLERGASQSPVATPPVETPAPGDVPTSSAPDIPLPGKDPRRLPPKVAVPRPAAVPPTLSQQIAPLPAPIEVRPAPAPRAQPRPRPAPPLVLTPPATSSPTRSPF